MENMTQALVDFFSHSMTKIVLSKPGSKAEPVRKLVLTRKKEGYQAESFTDKQVFHENISEDGLAAFCAGQLGVRFLQLDGWDEQYSYLVLLSRQGKVTTRKKALGEVPPPVVSMEHNRTKHYILPEGTAIPPLVDMGIFTQEGRVVRTMYDKFRQINRFVELVDDTLKGQQPKSLNIIDFGCGKSYLTFVLYYYFTQIRKIPVRMVGLDLKADVIAKCNEAARRYGYENLHFQLGDISGYQCDFPVDMVISLHACDTATDYALFNAIRWKARMIFSVPCCQHELNGQMESESLALLTRYGIVQERTAALLTDAIRGNLLEANGYKAQLLEFIDLTHTPKNILIRALRHPASASTRQKAMEEVEAVLKEFHLNPTLYRLLREEANNNTETEKER